MLPCYNPATRWVASVLKNAAALTERFPDDRFAFIVVDDGSPAKPTMAQMNALAAQGVEMLTYVENRGKGYALRTGFAHVEAELYLFTDVDFPYELDSVSEVIEQLKAKRADIVVGVRDDSYYHHIPRRRRWLSKTIKSLNRVLFRVKIADTQGGLKGFNERGKSVFLQTTIDRFLFDLEFIKLASRHSELRLTALPVQLNHGVELTHFNLKALLRELNDYWLIFRR